MFPNPSQSKDVELLNAGYRYAWSLCHNQQDAEDLLQDAWYRLVKRYKRSPEKSLLFTSIRNQYIDCYRRSQKFPSVSLEDHHHTNNTPIDSVESAFATAEEMQIQMSRLRDKEREALYLSVVEGYTADEIAGMTNSARGTVLSLLQRSKAKLRNWMEADAATEEETRSAKVIPLRQGEKKR